MIYAQPRFDAAFRGKLQRKETFALYEFVEGETEYCKREGWGRVGLSAFACLQHTTVTEVEPTPLPRLHRGRIMPYYYARLKGREEKIPAPVWQHRRALRDGDEPIDTLVGDHDYAFTHRRRTRDGVILTDRFFRVVKERDIRRLKPSTFQGTDVEANPIPEGATLAWSISWRFAYIREEPGEGEKVLGRLPHQRTIHLLDEPKTRRRVAYFPRFDGEPGWLSGKEVRLLRTMEPPSNIADGQLWLDVDLDQQTLAVYRGTALKFATIISSGSHKHPTPPGTYRIVTKQTTGDMRSRADEDEPYHVEAVPWVQYFDGRYALHGTFWHNRFGRRTSHGCINLSAIDARHIYEMSAPHVRPGWVMAYEHADELGTVVRIREGQTEPPDRRGEALTRYSRSK